MGTGTALDWCTVMRARACVCVCVFVCSAMHELSAMVRINLPEHVLRSTDADELLLCNVQINATRKYSRLVCFLAATL